MTLDKEEFKTLLEAIKDNKLKLVKTFRKNKKYTMANKYKDTAYELESIINLLEDDEYYKVVKSIYLEK